MYSIARYHESLRNGETTCHQTVSAFLKRIAEHEKLNAFTEIYAEEALSSAKTLDERRKNGMSTGKLHGVVIAIKDVICYKGRKVTAASKMLGDFQSLFHATAVRRLLDEEAIIIGSCNCDEFAMGSSNEHSAYGPVLNAANTAHVPGGSSGGSAVAVQAGLCMLSLGSDTGGSVRQPAGFCGIVGMKPGYGYVSRHGLVAYASSFDQIGVMGTTLDDVALVLQIIGGPDGFDSTALPTVPEPLTEEDNPTGCRVIRKTGTGRKFRFAFFKEAVRHPALDGEIARSVNACINRLSDAGHSIEAVSFPLLDYAVPAYYVLTTAEASTNLSRYDGVRYGYRSPAAAESTHDFYAANRSEGFGDEVKRRILLGTFVLSAGYHDAYFGKAQRVRSLLSQQVEALFRNHDILLLPTSPTTAFRIGENMQDPLAMYLADIYTVPANLAGIPAISLPLFRHTNGLPFGLQLMAARKDELTLLQAAQVLQGMYGAQTGNGPAATQ